MAPEEQGQGSSLNNRLQNEYFRFSFFQAVNLLERMSPDRKSIGSALSPGEEAARFLVRPGFAFAPSDISDLRCPEGEGPTEMEVAFMGLVGPSGVLPHWYNELALEKHQHKDDGLGSFLDIFHHRLISLFYLAWKKYRFSASYRPGATDRFSNYLLCLAGLGTEGVCEGIGLPREPLVYYGGLCSRQVPSAVAVEAAVAYFSGAEARVEQFIDRIIPLDPDDLTHLGSTNGELGVNAVCGSEAWENQTYFRVSLGPMDYRGYVRFLPIGDMLRPMFSLIRYMTGLEFEFEVCLYLKREDVFPCRLGGEESPESPRLGWSTWLHTAGETYPEDPYITFQ